MPSKKQSADKFVCTTAARFCDRPEVQKPRFLSPELVESLGACGITCTGRYADEGKEAGRCGLPDATEDVVATNIIEEAVKNMSPSTPAALYYGPRGLQRYLRSVPVSAACDAGLQVARRIFERGEESLSAINAEVGRFGLTVEHRQSS
jgi:hypothetical protein